MAPFPSVRGARPDVVGFAQAWNGVILAMLAVGMAIGMVCSASGLNAVATNCLPFAVLFALALWHQRNLMNRQRVGWLNQIILSIVGLWCFPLGTVINCVVLYSWFGTEAVGWFASN